MSAWTLVACLVALRDEFDLIAPSRAKASDGAIGDTVHQAAGSSDHLPDEDFPALRGKDDDLLNEVHAIDVDSGLRTTGWSMDRAVQVIVGRHRDGRDDRLQNVIYNRRIWSRSWGWTARAYHGPSPHTEHAHFSARYSTAQENDTRPWGLAEDDEEDMVNAEDRTAIARENAVLLGPRLDTLDAGLQTLTVLAKTVLLAVRQDAAGGLKLRDQVTAGDIADAGRDAAMPALLAQALGDDGLTQLLRGLPADRRAAIVAAVQPAP